MSHEEDDRIDEARSVAEDTPGVEAEESEGQVLMSESSDVERTPAGESAGSSTEPTVPLEDYQRLQAEIENFRKRMIRDQTRSVELATKGLVERLLPVLDHFNLAIEHDEAGSGVQLAFKELIEILGAEGLQEIEVQPGEVFDPAVHHGVDVYTDPQAEHETVGQVRRRGYSFKGHVFRAPEVVVAQPAGTDEEG
ncbi:MAG: nucleotide exchange factor GrpE [Actinomycetota bacterium]